MQGTNYRWCSFFPNFQFPINPAAKESRRQNASLREDKQWWAWSWERTCIFSVLSFKQLINASKPDFLIPRLRALPVVMCHCVLQKMNGWSGNYTFCNQNVSLIVNRVNQKLQLYGILPEVTKIALFFHFVTLSAFLPDFLWPLIHALRFAFFKRRAEDVVSWQPGSGCHSPSKVSTELQPAPREGAPQRGSNTMHHHSRAMWQPRILQN